MIVLIAIQKDMIEIELNNSISRITHTKGLFPVDLYRQLRYLLSYEMDANKAKYGGFKYAFRQHLLDKQGNFPTGLFKTLQTYLADNEIKFKVIDKRKKPSKYDDLPPVKLPHTPYPEQETSALKAKVYERGIICAPTGSGKSTIIALIINKLQVPTLVVVPSLELKRQLIESLSIAYGIDYVGDEGKFIWVENVQSLETKHKVHNYHAVIIDEFHHSAAKTYQDLNKNAWNEIYYRIGLTATPFRTREGENMLLTSILSDVIYKISYETAVTNRYIVPLEAYYIEIPKTTCDGHTWQQVYNQLVVNNTLRNQIVAKLLQRFFDQNVSTLCLVKEIKHGENILKLLPTPIPYAKGENDDNTTLIDNFNFKGPSSLIGTIGVIGEGVDTKAAEFVILAALGRSKGQFMQQVGRCLRTFPGKTSGKVIIFKDPSHPWTLGHFRAQVKILKEEYGIVPKKLDVSDLS